MVAIADASNGADQPQQRNGSGHEPGAIEHRAQTSSVHGGDEPGSEQECLVVQGDQDTAGCDEQFEFEFALDLLLGAFRRLRDDGWSSQR